MKEYLHSCNEVIANYNTTENGLSSKEASLRLANNGKNKLKEGKKESLFIRFLKQFAEPMTIILLVAAVVSGILEIVEHSFPVDAVIILAVVFINATLGVIQESKAEKSPD